ncbi:hypothetical protein D9611_013771 [Ephemerocybe angulata]|uniref:CCHC-type domain-containing protein n=1 Tax=Ephemerocybe angulata TaxID=980116 RepID=A0A8H5C5H1_9AGAR|nr:hypothetical protein D9611_013771 [Tulosesus angulatus]
MAGEQARIRALDPDATGEGFPGLPMSNKNFPNSYSANRPKYDSTKPEEFLEYVRQVEDVISACEIIPDRLKKKALVHFRDVSEQSLWTTLPEYKTGTYAEFKEKLFLYHPTAALQNRGSLARIQLLCARHQGIGLDASHTLLQFALKFRAEAAKLEKHLMSNNELVNLFLGALDEPFRTKAWEVLSKEAETDDTLEVVAGEKIIPFDRWISCAEKLAVQRERFGERFGGKKGGILAKPSVVSATPSTPAVTPAAPSKLYEPGWNDEPTVKVEYEDLEHRVLQGKLSAIDKKMISRDAYMETQLEELRAGQGRADKFMRQPNNFAVATQQNNPGSRGGFGFGNNTRGPPPSAGSICYYCNGQGHFANDCQAKQKHISEGKIVSGPDGTFDKHGNRLRNMPGTSLKEVVDKLPMPTASQNIQHYYDDSADYVRDQFHQAPYQESEMITRDEMNILRDEIYHLSSLREQGSSARAKNMQPQAQFVQKPVVEPWKELQQEQKRSNQLMSQLVAALTPMVGRNQFPLQTRSGANQGGEDDEVKDTAVAKRTVGRDKASPEVRNNKPSRKATVEDEEDDEDEEPIKRGPPSGVKKVFNPRAPRGVRFETVEVGGTSQAAPKLKDRPFVLVPPLKTTPLKTPTREDVQQGREGRSDPKTALPRLEKKGPAYQHKAPIEEAESLSRIMEELLSTRFTTSLKDLASISAPAREYLKKMITKKKIAIDNKEKASDLEYQIIALIDLMSTEYKARAVQMCNILEAEEELGEMEIPDPEREEEEEPGTSCLPRKSFWHKGFRRYPTEPS